MFRSEAVAAAAQAVLPSAKAVGWIVTAGSAMFMAGVGATLRTSEYASLPFDVGVLESQVTTHANALEDLQDDVSNNAYDLTRIRCLTRLSATGQIVDPLEIDDVCP